MPRFIDCNTQTLISTSYKVMYSSLVKVGKFTQISNAEFAALVAERSNKPGFRHLMPVRDPYLRLASFFVDKLRRDLERTSGPWQYCQRIFFPLLGVGADDPFDRIKEALLAISFGSFVEMLPRIYSDSHLCQQFPLLILPGHSLHSQTQIFRLETEATQFWEEVGVSSPPWANRSEQLPDLATLTRHQLDIVNAVYACDFSCFGYDRR